MNRLGSLGVARNPMPLNLTSPQFEPFFASVVRSACALTRCETGALLIDQRLFDAPDCPFPPEWTEAALQFSAEACGYEPAMRPWPHQADPLQVVLHRALSAEGPLGDLILVGGPQDHLDGRGRLLAGFAAELAALLGWVRQGSSVAAAADVLESIRAITSDPLVQRSDSDGLATPDLARVARLLQAGRVAALEPGGRYVEWPAEGGDPTRRAAREELARSVAGAQGPVSSASAGNERDLAAGGVTQMVGASLPAAQGEAGAIVLFDPLDQPFDDFDADALAVLVTQLAGAAPSRPGSVDMDGIRAAESLHLAGELHDGPIQLLTGAVMEAEFALRMIDDDPALAAQSVQKARDEARRVIGQLRSLVFDLRLANVTELGLVEALRDYAQDFTQTNGLSLDFRVEGELIELQTNMAQGLFLIAREALQNVSSHAQATGVRVAIEFSPQAVTARVEDNGVGFDVQPLLSRATSERHFGLLGIQERAARLNGRAVIVSQPNIGTIVEAEIPLMETD